MESHRILNIKSAGDAIPLMVRFIRKWPPYIHREHIAYLLIDNHDDAIQANVHHLDKPYFENQIRLMSCYEIDNYICEPTATYARVVNHPAAIRLTKNMLIKEVHPPPQFPIYHFNLCDYDGLNQRVNQKDLLTDYAGRLDSIENKTTARGTNLLRLNMTDISKHTIQVTIWEEIIPRFDKAAMESAEKPVLAVITSTTVTPFLAKPQLSSTRATYIYFNPETNATASLRARFKEEAPQLPTQEQEQPVTLLQAQPTSTISEIQAYRAIERQERTFICQATITSLANTRTWYYRQCPACNRKLYAKRGKWSCGTHDDITEPKLMYTVNATITDATGTTSTTMFDHAVNSLLGVQCQTLVLEQGYDDQSTLPEPLLALTGITATLHIQYSPHSYNLKVNRATQSTNEENVSTTPPSQTSITQELEKQSADALHITHIKRPLFTPTDTEDTKRTKYQE